MHTRILEKSESPQWDEFVKKHPLGTVHQMSAWGRFQNRSKLRDKSWIIAILENEKIIGGSLVIRHKMPRKMSFLYCPRGPLLDYTAPQEMLDLITTKLKSIAKEENTIFLRIDPPLEELPSIKGFTKGKGFQPEHTLILDLTLSEEEILKQMKPKGRYNIKLAQKKGVKVRKADPKNIETYNKDIADFYKILQETTSRDGFSGHNEEFYHSMLEVLIPEEMAELYLAEYEGEILGGLIATFSNHKCIYYYGASSNTNRNLMAPYLLQWEAIQEAKSRNYKTYDFLGIAPNNAKNHPWQGVTEFKKKFGGYEKSFAPPLEHSFRPFHYWAYRLYKFIQG